MRQNKDFTVKKERLISLTLDLKFIFKIVGYICLLIFIWYIIEYEHLDIYLVKDKDKSETYLFTILVSLMLMVFLVSCGMVFEIKKTKYRVLIIFFILSLIISGYTNLGFGFKFNTNFGLLVYENYESNSYKGVKFFILNFPSFLIWIYVISLFFEREKE